MFLIDWFSSYVFVSIQNDILLCHFMKITLKNETGSVREIVKLIECFQMHNIN